MTHFPVSSKSHPYTVITPDTPLENLEDFFNQKGTDFALGQWPLKSSLLTCSDGRGATMGPCRCD